LVYSANINCNFVIKHDKNHVFKDLSDLPLNKKEMVFLRFLDQQLALTENNESIIKSLLSKYPLDTKVVIWDERGIEIIEVLQINEIFNL
jgi:hypothetical protein